MHRLPENVRKSLERIVKDMRLNERVYGIGLFGSWSRGDAETSSDADLLIIYENIEDEYIERIISGGVFVDLDFIPKSWIKGIVPPEIDQKLCEAQIFYDRNWALANAKLLITNIYSSPERVRLRIRNHVIESDIYFSRAASALFKGDLKSAQLFSTVALEKALIILMERALRPISNSHFIQEAEESAKKLEAQSLFNFYLDATKLHEADGELAKEKLELLKIVLNEISHVVNEHSKNVEELHPKAKKNIKYYFNPAFVEGAVFRIESLIASNKLAEAVHYIKSLATIAIEKYAILRASIEKSALDYTCLISFLESAEKRKPKHYQNITNLLDLDNLRKEEVGETVKMVREMLLKIRGRGNFNQKPHI